MLAYLLIPLLGYASNWILTPSQKVTETGMAVQVGDRFSDLSPELQTALRSSKHWDVNNSRWDGTAVNTDNCWTFNDDCHPDYKHHVFKIANQDHPGYTYTITFSDNYYVLNINDNYGLR